MLGVVLRFTPLRFSGDVVEDDHEFLSTCHERLCSFGLLESRTADFIAY